MMLDPACTKSLTFREFVNGPNTLSKSTAISNSDNWTPVFKLYRYGSFWLIKPKACTNQKVVRDTSCLTEIKASRSAFLVAKSAKSAKYRVFCGYT